MSLGQDIGVAGIIKVRTDIRRRVVAGTFVRKATHARRSTHSQAGLQDGKGRRRMNRSRLFWPSDAVTRGRRKYLTVAGRFAAQRSTDLGGLRKTS